MGPKLELTDVSTIHARMSSIVVNVVQILRVVMLMRTHSEYNRFGQTG